MELKYKILKRGAKIIRPREGDAGYDLVAPKGVILNPKDLTRVELGIAIELPSKDYVGILKDRSSMAIKGISVMGGVIDSAYRGEISVLFYNHSAYPLSINKGDKVVQMVIVPIITPLMSEEELSESERSIHGFGSTDLQT